MSVGRLSSVVAPVPRKGVSAEQKSAESGENRMYA